uniref:Calbindin 2 n=1 Tax=Buteo japonicus TaxID=224669 RepID=A0A8C0BI23_9AVES
MGTKPPAPYKQAQGTSLGLCPCSELQHVEASALCKFGHCRVCITPGISWCFFAATVTSEPCPHAEGDRSCIPQDHPSLTSCPLTLWGVGCKELENFFQELESARKGAGVPDSKNDDLGDKMKEFMHKYDKNADGKIEMAELAQILPTEENFLLCFRQHVGSSSEFMEAWRRYDTDRSGYIEANELKGFLSDLLKKANRPYDEPKLQEYTQTILRMFDMNGDGKLGLSEMSRNNKKKYPNIPVPCLHLCPLPHTPMFLATAQGMKLSSEEFNAIFAFYDKDGSGFIDENELDALLKDLYEKNKKEMNIQQLTNYRKSIMNLSDGGKLYRKELEIVLCNEPPM